MDGDPPDLPEESFSPEARDFVAKCLNKTPKLRPTYAMLLRHHWLTPLLKPPSEGADGPKATLESTDNGFPDTADEEVADWVSAAIERRKNGTMGKSQKPALHAAPLDAVSSPPMEKSNALE